MKRSVRSGIAIAGMAGGFWLLGQAVASADDAVNPASATADQASATQAGGGGGGGGGDATSTNTQDVAATNDVHNTATTGDVNAGGGISAVGVAAGNGNTVAADSGKGDVDATQKVTTVVWVSSEANGGTVSGSNNAAAGNGASNTATAEGTQNSETTGGSGKGGGDATSTNTQNVDAANTVRNTATTGDINAGGGLSAVEVQAGNGNDVLAASGSQNNQNKWHHQESGDVNASQTVDTSVAVDSAANGGSVTDSNNAWAGNGGSNSATATGVQNSETTGGNGQNGKEHWGHKSGSWWDHHGGNADSQNDQNVDATNNEHNSSSTGNIDVSGGVSAVEVIAGNGNTLYCTSKSGNVTCSQNITTIINIISQANGGSVSCSNNASAGNAGSAVCPVSHNSSKPASPGKKAAAPAAHKAAAPAAHKAAAPAAHKKASASAQPSGQLAFTGAETSLPLTLGLLALGAGGALTLAGRRRETATV
jgi:hypothetical protein